MNKEFIQSLTKNFESLATEIDGVECWFARDLQQPLGYDKWENFFKVIQKAKIACENAGNIVDDHFPGVRKMVSIGSQATREIDDIVLTRYACYLIAQNGDPRKDEIAFAQTYKDSVKDMAQSKTSWLCLWALLFALLQACAKPIPFSDPDEERFRHEVASPALRDSLQRGSVALGMPYFVVADICKEQKGARRIAVASPGSAQPLKESEGLGRRYVDPTIKIFMDEYHTDKGKLRVWYRLPDFYRMHVAGGDTLVAFWQEQRYEALIQYLYHENRLALAQALASLPAETKLYGEIRHVNAPDGRKISYWYNLKFWDDRQSVALTSISHELYPIVWMELENETVESFGWK